MLSGSFTHANRMNIYDIHGVQARTKNTYPLFLRKRGYYKKKILFDKGLILISSRH